MDCEESHLGNTIRCTSHYSVRDGQVVQPCTEDIAPSDSPDCREVDLASSHHKRQHQPESIIAYLSVTRRRFSESQTFGRFFDALPFLRSVVVFDGAGAPPFPFAIFVLRCRFHGLLHATWMVRDLPLLLSCVDGHRRDELCEDTDHRHLRNLHPLALRWGVRHGCSTQLGHTNLF